MEHDRRRTDDRMSEMQGAINGLTSNMTALTHEVRSLNQHLTGNGIGRGVLQRLDKVEEECAFTGANAKDKSDCIRQQAECWKNLDKRFAEIKRGQIEQWKITIMIIGVAVSTALGIISLLMR